MSRTMKRRTFLKWAGAAVSALGVRTAHAESPQVSAIVVGAGPAGLSAALELVERGVNVTLVEAGEQLGGKVKGWREEAGGTGVDAEHGIHGWWHQYVNFKDLLARYGLSDAVMPYGKDQNGMRMPGRIIESRDAMVRAILRAAREKGMTPFGPKWMKGRRFIRRNGAAESIAKLAGKSVSQWIEDGAPLTVYTAFDTMMAYSMYFVGPEDVDASTYYTGERFYFSATKQNDEVGWLRGNPDTLLWKPLAEAFTRQGGTLRMASPVTSLVVEDGRVVGVRLGEADVLHEANGPVEAWQKVERAGKPPIFLGPGAEGPKAFLGRCTHAGCFVDLGEEAFVCPCHGGRYNFDGTVQQGPPEQPLPALAVSTDSEGNFRVTDGTAEELKADFVVLAVDAPALAKLCGELLPQTTELKGCREVVARFWLDRDADPKARPAILLDEYTHASNGFLVHRLQDDAAAWSNEHGGAVIEIQAYRDLPQTRDRQAVLDAVWSDVPKIWPELEGAERLHETLTDGDRFTWFYPGWRKAGVPVEPGVEGLLIAGDHVLVDDCESQFMELAVLTGRMAANVVLESAGLEAVPVLPPV